LLKRHDLDYYTRAQIDARIAQVTPIVLEIRRRHLDQDQNDNDNSLQNQSSPTRQTGFRFGACAGASCTMP